MKLLLFADLHLDTNFDHNGPARRKAQRETLGRIVELAFEEKADALLCAGDLYEHDRFSPDTAAFLRTAFDVDLRVYLAPGDDDWYGPQSLYQQVDWSPNVHVFTEDTLEPVDLADGITLWGGANCAPAPAKGFLDGFAVARGGVNLALFHGPEPEDIAITGLDHAFLGHVHTPSHAPHHTYPGNPDPLTPGETGDRGAVLCTVHEDGTVSRKTFDVSAGRALLMPPAEPSPVPLHLGALADERTVRGQFVRDVEASSLDLPTKARVLAMGLRALEER
ncbi:phosphoesterase [Lentzea sp. NBRC 105346]|uniref:metallophosphoesterase family protein n=1 Tax=Lentzea sp. NBRC 105346 TaxID=3032205 RepID=UPI0024A43E98|nr:metallophosphoesterase [Lentzea sp. NBRC 105346]GLZ32436.1 phosphoesterase [Lentzea sp. NBRC 105346]